MRPGSTKSSGVLKTGAGDRSRALLADTMRLPTTLRSERAFARAGRHMACDEIVGFRRACAATVLLPLHEDSVP